MPTPVEVKGLVQTGGKTVRTALVTIPGIGTAAAYATGQAFGTKFTIDVPLSGIIHTAIYLDKDLESIECDLILFTRDFAGTADKSAFAPTDTELQDFLSTITFATFKAFSVNSVSTASALGIAYVAPERKLYCQMVTRGTPNIAAGNLPMVALTILSDE